MAAYRHVLYTALQGHGMISTRRHISALSVLQKHVATKNLSKPSENICLINTLEPSTSKCISRNRSSLSANTPPASTSTSNWSTSTSNSSESLSPSTSSSQNFSVPFDPLLVDSLLQNMDGDFPISDMPDPFVKDYRRCFLCNQNVKLDHKNVRLLSQFVSPYTGRIYGRAMTGLCIPMQKHVAKLIKRARMSGYMPFMLKDPKYLQDPQPYDPMAHRKVQ